MDVRTTLGHVSDANHCAEDARATTNGSCQYAGSEVDVAQPTPSEQIDKRFPRLITDLPDEVMRIIYKKLEEPINHDFKIRPTALALFQTEELRCREVVFDHAFPHLIGRLARTQKLSPDEKGSAFMDYAARIREAERPSQMKALAEISKHRDLSFAYAVGVLLDAIEKSPKPPTTDREIVTHTKSQMMAILDHPIEGRGRRLNVQINRLKNYHSDRFVASEHHDDILIAPRISEKTDLAHRAIEITGSIPIYQRANVLIQCHSLLENTPAPEYPQLFKAYLKAMESSIKLDYQTLWSAISEDAVRLNIESIPLLRKYLLTETDLDSIPRIFKRYLLVTIGTPHEDHVPIYQDIIDQASYIKDDRALCLTMSRAGTVMTEITDVADRTRFLHFLFQPLESRSMPLDFNVRYVVANYVLHLPAQKRAVEERKLLQYVPILTPDGTAKTDRTAVDYLAHHDNFDLQFAFQTFIEDWMVQQKELSGTDRPILYPGP